MSWLDRLKQVINPYRVGENGILQQVMEPAGILPDYNFIFLAGSGERA